jgi:hypothetical protein
VPGCYLDREGIAAGGHKKMSERLGADLHYQHEDNDVGKPAHINTIALVIHMRIR